MSMLWVGRWSIAGFTSKLMFIPRCSDTRPYSLSVSPSVKRAGVRIRNKNKQKEEENIKTVCMLQDAGERKGNINNKIWQKKRKELRKSMCLGGSKHNV